MILEAWRPARLAGPSIRASALPGLDNSRYHPEQPAQTGAAGPGSPGRCVMPKYLARASYTAEGAQGLRKDKASGRRAEATKFIESLGGKLECFYFAFGE